MIFVFWHDVIYDVTVASYKVCLYFFWYQWTREGHSYPLDISKITLDISSIGFRDLGGGRNLPPPPPPGCEMGPKSPALLGLSNLNSFPPFYYQTVVQAKYCSANVLFSRENDEFNAPVCFCNVSRNWPFALKWHFGYSSIFKDTMSHRNHG